MGNRQEKTTKKFGFPASRNDLIEQVLQIWDEIDEELCVKLAESVKKRLNVFG